MGIRRGSRHEVEGVGVGSRKAEWKDKMGKGKGKSKWEKKVRLIE